MATTITGFDITRESISDYTKFGQKKHYLIFIMAAVRNRSSTITELNFLAAPVEQLIFSQAQHTIIIKGNRIENINISNLL